MTAHDPSRPTPADAALADDPDLLLAWADPHTWQAAHPCDCDALCQCDKEAE